MRRTTTWILIAISLILLGSILFGGVLATLNWDFSKLATSQFITTTYTLDQNIQNINLTTNSADIIIVPSTSTKTSVTCDEYQNAKHTVEIKDNTLFVQVVDTQKWYNHIGIRFKKPKITISLPQARYGALCAQTRTGDVNIPKDFLFDSISITENTGDVTNYASASETVQITANTGSICLLNTSASAVDLSVSTGDITVENVTVQQDINIKTGTGDARILNVQCRSIVSKGGTGNTSLKNVIASKTFSIEQDTGDINFNHCDATDIFLKANTGDIAGSLLTEKVFIAKSNTGDVEIPKTTTGGKCEAQTNTGDIEIEIE